MRKETYNKAEIEVISLTMTDVLVTSPASDDDDELPFVPGKKLFTAHIDPEPPMTSTALFLRLLSEAEPKKLNSPHCRGGS